MVFHTHQPTLIVTAYVTTQLITDRGIYLFACQQHGALVFLLYVFCSKKKISTAPSWGKMNLIK